MATQKWALTPGSPFQSFWDEPRAIPTSQEVYRKRNSYKLDHAIVQCIHIFSARNQWFLKTSFRGFLKERHCKRNMDENCVLSPFWWKDIVIGFSLDFYLEDREYRQTWLSNYDGWMFHSSIIFQILYGWTTGYIIEMEKWIWKLGTELEKLHH